MLCFWVNLVFVQVFILASKLLKSCLISLGTKFTRVKIGWVWLIVQMLLGFSQRCRDNPYFLYFLYQLYRFTEPKIDRLFLKDAGINYILLFCIKCIDWLELKIDWLSLKDATRIILLHNFLMKGGWGRKTFTLLLLAFVL